MPLMPFHVLGIWLRGLFSLALVLAGLSLLGQWYTHREILVEEEVSEPVRQEQPEAVPDLPPRPEVRKVVVHRVPWRFGFNRETGFLLSGLALAGWSLGGGLLAALLFRPKRLEPDPKESRRNASREQPGTVRRQLPRPDGSELQVEVCGPAIGPALVFTHGWGLNSEEWRYVRQTLGDRYRLIAWDLPGLGGSTSPANRDWSLDRLAEDLDAVVALAGDQPAVLLGHSIGGMITLTWCRLFGASLGTRVQSLVLIHTTYTNPVRTTSQAALYTALQKPLLEPLCYLMIWFSPLVRVLNWLSYLNGSLHRSSEKASFSGREPREQLDYVVRCFLHDSPAVLARGFLAMFRYDATDILSTISVPTLVVAADRDPTCKPEASEFMARSIPHARLVTLGLAKHMGLLERHDPFDGLVDQFVGQGAG